MKFIKSKKSIILVLILTLLVSLITPVGGQVQAATIKLNKSQATLEAGKTLQLKVTGTNSASSWLSSDKAVATVSQKGKVKALRSGNAIITASVNKKKYTCKVTVTEPVSTVDYLGDRTVEYVKAEECHRLFFSLQDGNHNKITANATVDIKIINDAGETVYDKSHKVGKEDFGSWTNSLYGTRLLCSIDILDSDITAGASKKGTIHFTVYNGNNFAFDESQLTISDLPYISITNSCSISLPAMPAFVNYYSYSGRIQSSIKVEDIRYEFGEAYDGKSVNLIIYFTGEMISNSSTASSYGHIGYKLSKDGYVVKSGTHLTTQLNTGDKFKDSDERFYNLEPGVYTLEIMNVQ